MLRFRLIQIFIVFLVLLLASASNPALGDAAISKSPHVGVPDFNKVTSTTNSIINISKPEMENISLQAQKLNLIGQLGGRTRAVSVQGNYAYVGIGPRLVLLSFSSPNNPVVVGQSDVLPDIVKDIAIGGNYAYVADGSGGLRIFNVSDPVTPVVVGLYRPSDSYSAVAVAIAGNYAYVADSATLRILNVSDPNNPYEAGSYTAPFDYFSRVNVQGNYAYVVAGPFPYYGGAYSLRIVNVTNPTAPAEVGHYDPSDGISNVTLIGNYAYITTTGLTNFHIIDVSNPASPIEVGSCHAFGNAIDVAVTGVYAYVLDDSWSFISTIDISNPFAPTPVANSNLTDRSTWWNFGGFQSITMAGNHAYVTENGKGGLRVIGLGGQIWLYDVGAYSAPGVAQDVTIMNGYAYVADDGGLQVVDITNPDLLVEVGHSYESPQANAVDIQGRYAYVVTRSDLKIYDVANPAMPALTGSINAPGSDVVVSNTYAYVASCCVFYSGSSYSMQVIDIANKSAPKKVGLLALAESAQKIDLQGSYVYIADGASGLQIANIANPANPVAVFAYSPPGFASDVVVSGTYAYLADGSGGLRILNISNPAAPFTISSYASINASRVFVEGVYAYVSDSINVHMLDISNPSTPIEIATYSLPRAENAIYANGSLVYIADGEGGLIVLRHSSITSAYIPAGGGLLTSAADNTTYYFPAGCFTYPVTITHTLLLPNEVSSLEGLINAGHRFEVTGTYTNGIQPALPLTPYTISIHYSYSEVAAIDESTIALYYWDGFQWLKETTSAVDTTNHFVTATPDHFSRWMLAGTPPSYPNRVYLPINMRNFTPFDLTITGLEFTQAIQDPANSVPLVAVHPTVARIYANTNSVKPVNDVYLSISAARNGLPLPGSPQIAGPWAVFPNPSRGSFGQSYNVKLPTIWLSGQIALTATIDSSNTVTEANEANNTASAILTFNVVPPLIIKLIPINYTDSSQGIFYPAPITDTISDEIRNMYPLSVVSASFHTPISFTGRLDWGSDYEQLLAIVNAVKLTDGTPASQVYYGLIPDAPTASAGIAYLGNRVSMGIYTSPGTAVHEIGHNFGLPHAPCGVPGFVDPYYPYPNASIGQYGFDVLRYRIWSPVAPDYTKDVMSYCSPEWFSDYNYKKLYADQMIHGLSRADKAPADSLLIRATFNADNVPILQPVYGFSAVATEVPASSDYTLEMLNTTGEVILSQPVTLYQAEEEGFVARTISAMVPRPSQTVAKLRLLKSSRTVAERVLVNISKQAFMAPEIAQTADTLTVRWGAPDIPALVRYTVDNGKSWTTVGLDVLGGELQLDWKTLPRGQGYFEIGLADTITPTVRTVSFTLGG